MVGRFGVPVSFLWPSFSLLWVTFVFLGSQKDRFGFGLLLAFLYKNSLSSWRARVIQPTAATEPGGLLSAGVTQLQVQMKFGAQTADRWVRVGHEPRPQSPAKWSPGNQ